MSKRAEVPRQTCLSSGFKTEEDNDVPNATEQKNPPRATVAGAPGQETSSTHVYVRDHYNFSDRAEPSEKSPSDGWRAVYAAMEVGVR